MTEAHAKGPRYDGRFDQPAKPSTNAGSDFRQELVSHLPHLRAVARALTGHRDRADDLVNDTVLKALSAEAQFQPGTYLKAWLMTILRNHYINGLRRTRIEVETIGDIPEGALPSAPNQEHVVEVNEVANALQRMSVEHREILVLVSAAGLSYEEAAEVCGCAVGTIKSRLNRARGELKKVLAKSRGLAGEGRRDGPNPSGTNPLPRAI
ncbi:MAG: polymerase ECF-type sigma factor EcfG [Rhodospirillales bacterium]|nr:polymerase ECF-type sigma factor EcfG [Rhodospirillales bacterium]